jgi:protein-S-isoprenylcysteine O-methyltransferase Ste14
MRLEQQFHFAFALAFVLLLGLRIYYHRLAKVWQNRQNRSEPCWMDVIRFTLAFPYVIAVLIYLAKPELLAWANFALPEAARWLGLALTYASLPLAWWIHRNLGRNFSGELRIIPDHKLVTTGPYRYVRHPMYSMFVLTALGFLLLTANWFIGGPYLAVLILVMTLRTPKEEAMMLRAFGDEYAAYMQRTGKFLPKLSM